MKESQFRCGHYMWRHQHVTFYPEHPTYCSSCPCNKFKQRSIWKRLGDRFAANA